MKTLCIYLYVFIYIYTSYIKLCGWSCGCMQVDAYIQWWGSSKLVNA